MMALMLRVSCSCSRARRSCLRVRRSCLRARRSCRVRIRFKVC
jgi:hypothetical protein